MYLLVGSVMRKSTSMYARPFVMLCAFAMLLSVGSLANAGPRDCAPPIFTNYPAASVNKNHCSAFRFDFDATDGGNSPAADPVTFATSVGTINATTGQLSVPTLPACGMTAVVVTATNSCGGSTDYSFEIVWTNNRPQVVNEAPDNQLDCPAGEVIEYDFNSVDPDPCDPARWSVAALNDVVYAPLVTSTGVFRWTTDISEGGFIKQFRLIVVDACGGADTTLLSVNVLDHVPQMFAIEKVHDGHLGSIQEVSISRLAGTKPLGGFTFLIAFEAPPLGLVSAEPGTGLINCGWEYFTCSYLSPVEVCGGDCPTALIRITAIADVNEVGGAPLCNQFGPYTEIAKLKFYILPDQHYECMAFPIRFAWQGCDDNIATSVDSETRWISSRVFDFENTEVFNDPNYEITDSVCREGIAYGGACSDCEGSADRDIVFRNGYIDNNCNYFETVGDLNGNHIAYEIADAHLYSQYFIYGDAALDPNPKYREFQIAQSDANFDDIVLTPADLAYMLRVIVGDALPYPKLEYVSSRARVEVLGGTVSIESDDSVTIAAMVFTVTGDVTVESRSNLRVDHNVRDGKLRVLVWPGFDDMTVFLPPGVHEVVKVEGAVLDSIRLSNYVGNMMQVAVARRTLPTQFALAQNFPNPFNPVTRINLELPQATDWTLDIFNVSGQHIESFSGHGVGIVTVEWNAANQPSGVYFYKLVTNGFTATKKMVLLK